MRIAPYSAVQSALVMTTLSDYLKELTGERGDHMKLRKISR
jgi:hypothetical protein